MKVNLHTHTYRCKHATGNVADYCSAAQAAEVQVLGISDHTPLPDQRWPSVRMLMPELGEHLQEIEAAQRQFSKLRILSAMECEWAPEYESFYREVLLDKHRLDYLIGAVHFLPPRQAGENWSNIHNLPLSDEELLTYSRYFISSMGSGLFAFMAHPDLFMMCRPRWDSSTESCARDMLVAAASLQVPLEVNGYGLRKPMINSDEGMRRGYPYRAFWELAQEYNIRYIINTDAHQPKDTLGNYQEVVDFIHGLELVEADMSYLWKD